jgi:two-component system, NtrC family, sensor kinase
MKKAAITLFLILFVQNIGFSQNLWREGARNRLAEAKDDTTRVLALAELSNIFKYNQPDSAMYYASKAITLSKQIGFPRGEAEALRWMVVTQRTLGNQAQALKINLQALKIAKENNLVLEEAMELALLGVASQNSKKYETAKQYYRESKKLFDSIRKVDYSLVVQIYIGSTFLDLNQLDSALYYCKLVFDYPLKEKWVSVYADYSMGEIHYKMGNFNLALDFYRQSISLANEANDLFMANLSIAKVYKEINKPDSCNYYAQKALGIAQESGFIQNLIDANVFLSEVFELSDTKKALQYSRTAITYKDSLDIIRNSSTMESFMDFDEQQRQFELENAKFEFQSRLRMSIFLGSTFALLIIAIFLFILSRRKQKAKLKIESAFNQLKSTQNQLIQSEKMASLGALTAGIAHEIQNPLNFVNNFSEVSNELIVEVEEERAKNQESRDENLVSEILNDIKKNLEKINHHGKRAESIVKGMLLHSRGTSGHKEPTDINALCDEYFRLSYHGFRAKDKSFNADYITEFDPNLPKINVVPQDIGRVLLNLINNAFYAVDKRSKEIEDSYNPTVSVSTKKINGKIEVSVKDNGNGIPQNVLSKIFQPFFTTKSAGQGTGLGLSLAYDIVKAHGGEIKVETREGEGSDFTIELPIS